MTNLSIEDVRHVAQLARLGLDDSQLEVMAGELDMIIESIGKISDLDLDGVKPTTHALEIVNVFGDDIPHVSLTPEQALANAPDPQDGLFRVPRML